MQNILEVKNLKIAFRTNSGVLKAVRDISFNLEKGRTLAIVGESGSGKSVTSRAIMGIQAGNAITEGGEIFYDGMDLLRIPEEDMQKIRGDKISMIFQDPLSSLNPIVRIGRQITEAMLLKNKTSRKEARHNFKTMLETLRKNMLAAAPGEDEKINGMISTFSRFCTEGNKLENDYNEASGQAQDLLAAIEDTLFLSEKKQRVDTRAKLKDFSSRLRRIRDPFLTGGMEGRMDELSSRFSSLSGNVKVTPAGQNQPEETVTLLKDAEAFLNEVLNREKPNFFRIGYYHMRHPGEQLNGQDISALNEKALQELNSGFMDEFLTYMDKGVEHSFRNALEAKRDLIPDLESAAEFYSGDFEKDPERMKKIKTLSRKVKTSIDRLEVTKDTAAYAFEGSLTNAVEEYFKHIRMNPKEEARFARQTAKRDRLIARGRSVTWKVLPKNVYDLNDLKGNILTVVNRLKEHYGSFIDASGNVDIRGRSVSIVDYLKNQSSLAVANITKAMARERAIKLMEEVGIHEPRERFYQYPFEFSGGMRQRIVIAIALAADPDILICDEPTTALDVTIQSQILELINRLKAERHLSVIFITHDLGVVANMADDIAVMYAGKIVEFGTADDIFYDPRHPYTWALLSSMPDLDTKEKLEAIPGTPPNMIYPPVGDAFADRNKYAMEIDFEQQPPMFRISDTHYAATWLLHPDAPKVETPKVITDRIERMTKKLQTEGGAQNV